MIRSPYDIEIRLCSNTGKVYDTINDKTAPGLALNLELEELYLGGLDTFSFTLPNFNEKIITRNTVCQFYLDGELYASGWVDQTPIEDTKTNTARIQGRGFWAKWENMNVEKVKISRKLSIKNLVLDVVTNARQNNSTTDAPVFITVNVNSIDTGALAVTQFEVEDTPLTEALETIVNLISATNDYRCYINYDRQLIIDNLTNIHAYRKAAWFQGHDFLSLKYKEDVSGVVNDVRVFYNGEKCEGSPRLMAHEQDTNSISRYGKIEKKAVHPILLDEFTAINYARSILRKAQIVGRATVSGITQKLSTWGIYTLSTNKRKQYVSVTECDSLTGWDTSNWSPGQLEITKEEVITGVYSAKFTTVFGSLNKSANYILPEVIIFPEKLRIWIYFKVAITHLNFVIYDETDTAVEIVAFEVSKHVIGVNPGGSRDEGGLDVDKPPVEKLGIKKVDNLKPNIWFPLVLPINRAKSIKKIRINNKENHAAVFYIDRIDVQTNSYSTYTLPLEKVKTTTAGGVKVEAEFGKKTTNLIKTLLEKIPQKTLASTSTRFQPPIRTTAFDENKDFVMKLASTQTARRRRSVRGRAGEEVSRGTGIIGRQGGGSLTVVDGQDYLIRGSELKNSLLTEQNLFSPVSSLISNLIPNRIQFYINYTFKEKVYGYGIFYTNSTFYIYINKGFFFKKQVYSNNRTQYSFLAWVPLTEYKRIFLLGGVGTITCNFRPDWKDASVIEKVIGDEGKVGLRVYYISNSELRYETDFNASFYYWGTWQHNI